MCRRNEPKKESHADVKQKKQTKVKRKTQKMVKARFCYLLLSVFLFQVCSFLLGSSFLILHRRLTVSRTRNHMSTFT